MLGKKATTAILSATVSAMLIGPAGTALGSNSQTVNTSEAYVDIAIASGFVPVFIDTCDAAIGGSSTVGCQTHGDFVAGSAAGQQPLLLRGCRRGAVDIPWRPSWPDG